MSIEEDQSKFLDCALKTVKSRSIDMKNSIDKNDIRQCLRDAGEMISELKTSLLIPKNYYQLYQTIFDEIQYLQNYFREQSMHGRRIKNLYEAVQNCIGIVPRMYLMITIGAIFIESKQCDSEELINDLTQLIKGIQNPLRGLFSRYFFLKMIKNYFPCCIKKNSNEETKYLYKTIDIIIDNFNEMNKLWIRINDMKENEEKTFGNNCSDQETLKEHILQERNELKILVGENITRLAYLDNLTLEIYKNKLLPMVLNIIVECKDSLAQQYLIDCIINAFPDEYNIKCINEIIRTINKFDNGVDKKSIYENIIDKALSKDTGSIYTQEDKSNLINLVNDAIKGFNEEIDIFFNISNEGEKSNDGKSSIECQINTNINQSYKVTLHSSIDIEVMRLTEIQIKFMKLIIQCGTDDIKLDYINTIMNQCFNLISKIKGNHKMNKKGVQLILSLLSTSLESPVSIFDLKNFPDLMNFLDENNKLSLSLHIVNNLVNDYNLGTIDNKDKMLAIIELVKPLIMDVDADNKEITYQISENDIKTLSKICYVPCSKDPIEQLEIYILLKSNFLETKNELKIKNFLLSFINSLIILAYKVSMGYEYQIAKRIAKYKGIKKETAELYDFENFKNENGQHDINVFKVFYQNLYRLINESIDNLLPIAPESAVQLLNDACVEAFKNSMQEERDFFIESGFDFYNRSLQIIKDGKVKSENKLMLFSFLIGNYNIIKNIKEKEENKENEAEDKKEEGKEEEKEDKNVQDENSNELLKNKNEKLKNIRNDIYKSSQNLIKRNDQCLAMINCVKMFDNRNIDNIIECLHKAKKFADYAMTSPENAVLFVKIINEYIRCDLLYEEFGVKANAEEVNDLIEYIKNYLVTLKLEKKNYDIATYIEIYFNSTLEVILIYQKEKKGKLILNINLSK